MEGLQNISTYQEFKAATDREVYNQAEGFVRLGYLLRRAEDTDILKESGYKTVTEFAKAEYGLTETYVSRYININKRYSEDGYSDRLQSRFMGFGLAKLADMLTLTDQIVEAIPPEVTRAEIQEIKKEVAQEQQISDLEVLAEGKGTQEESLLSQVLREFYYGNQEEYEAVHRAIREEERWRHLLPDAMAPAGSAVKMVRISGEGRIMLTVRGKDQELELVKVRSGEKETFSWEKLRQCLNDLFGFYGEAKRDWEAIYQEDYPVKEEPQKSKKRAAPVVSIAKAKEPEKKPEDMEKPLNAQIAPVQPETSGQDTANEEINEVSVPKEKSLGGVKEKQQETMQEPEDMAEKPEEIQAVAAREEKEKPEKDAVSSLRTDAGEQVEKIKIALERGYYNMAKMEAKTLISILDEIGKELDRKGVPGQQEMKDYFQK